MLRYLALTTFALVVSMADASAGVEIHATCASEVSREPVHVRTLHDEITRALAGSPVTTRYTLDVSLVKLASSMVGGQLEVRAEVRGLISDARGIRWQSTSRANARGSVRDRALLQRDAIGAAARDLARSVRMRQLH